MPDQTTEDLQLAAERKPQPRTSSLTTRTTALPPSKLPASFLFFDNPTSTSPLSTTMSFVRAASRVRPCVRVGVVAPARRVLPVAARRAFNQTAVRKSDDPHAEESFEEFSARYEKEFDAVSDVFELQRNLNNAFAYDLVPSPSVIVAALKAARRVNDYPSAVRVFEGIKAKVENKGQYEEYLTELEPLREELGIVLKETMYPDSQFY